MYSEEPGEYQIEEVDLGGGGGGNMWHSSIRIANNGKPSKLTFSFNL